MKIALVALALAGCGLAQPGPLPRIVSAEPEGKGVDPDAALCRVIFSEPVDPAGLVDGRQLALVRSADVRAATNAVATPDGLGAATPAVPATVALTDGGRSAVLVPAAPLDPNAGYALVVGPHLHSVSGRPVLDREGRSRAFVLLFETGLPGDHAPPVARWLEPPSGPAPANLRRIAVAFDEPVLGALALESGPGADPVQLGPDRLGLGVAGTLPALLSVSLAAVRDLAGNPAAALAPLEVSRCADLQAPAPDGEGLTVEAGELSIRLATTLDEMARLGVEIASPAGQPACGAVPAAGAALERWGEALACPGQDPCTPGLVRCPGAVEAGGLCPGRTYQARLLAEDLAGQRAAPGPWITVATAAPSPRPVLTEVLVDAAAPESGGEFVEVANLGTGDADLAGYLLGKSTSSGSLSTCAIESVSGGPIPPGGHAVIAGGAYDGRYTLPEGTALYRCGAKSLLGGLANDRPPALVLQDPAGTAVSTIGIAEPAPRCGGLSVERIHPGGADAAANFACAAAAPGTPGACNGVTPAAQCPRRPW